jgi:hypothetical protein
VPRLVFEQHELPHLKPVPEVPFDVPRWTEAKVHPDHHVQVARALYSVPTAHVGKTLRVLVDKRSVRLCWHNDLVKSHLRSSPVSARQIRRTIPPERSRTRRALSTGSRRKPEPSESTSASTPIACWTARYRGRRCAKSMRC